MEKIVHDISHCCQTADLNARKIWGLLYPIFIKQFNGKTPLVHEFDSFLCDLKCFERQIIEQMKVNRKQAVFYWELNRSYTNVTDYALYYVYKITLNIGQNIIIEYLENLVEKELNTGNQ